MLWFESLICLSHSGTAKEVPQTAPQTEKEKTLFNLTLNVQDSKMVLQLGQQVIASVDINPDKITEQQKYNLIKFIADLYYNKLSFVHRTEEMNDQPCTSQKIHTIPNGSTIYVKGLNKLANVEEMKVTLHMSPENKLAITFKNTPSTGYFMWLGNSGKYGGWRRDRCWGKENTAGKSQFEIKKEVQS